MKKLREKTVCPQDFGLYGARRDVDKRLWPQIGWLAEIRVSSGWGNETIVQMRETLFSILYLVKSSRGNGTLNQLESWGWKREKKKKKPTKRTFPFAVELGGQ